jgi:hypothetical protein
MPVNAIIDLNANAPLLPGTGQVEKYDWGEFARLWNGNDMWGAHDWLNERWSRLTQSRLMGHNDPEALFLQALAFATLTLYFTQHGNQEGALLMLDDALVALARYRPGLMGVRVDPIIETLNELRPMIAGLAPDAECPLQPFVYRKLEYQH